MVIVLDRVKELDRPIRPAELSIEQKRAEQAREKEFSALTPREHLQQAQSLLKLGSTQEAIDNGYRHLKAIPGTAPEATEATMLRSSFEQSLQLRDQQANAAIIPHGGDDKRRQALALAFEEVLRQQGHEVSVSATSDQLWFDCSSALEPRSSCYAAYQSSKHLPSDLKAELRAVGITTLNFSPNGGMIPTWANNVK